MIRLLVFLAIAGVLAFCGATVPLGKRTFFGHVKAIWSSEEMTELKDGVKESAGPAADKLVNTDQVTAMEKVMLAMSDGGTKGAPGTARDPAKQEISDEDYEKMSPREQLEYARTAKQGANRS